MSRSVLLMSYWFPPVLTAEAIVTARVAKSLSDLGWEVHVVCGEHGGETDPDLARRYASDGVRVTPVGFRGVNRRLLRQARRFRPWTARRPDEFAAWRHEAAAAALLLTARVRFDVLYSRAQPFTGHLAALDVKAATSLPWVANFSDPWADNPLVPRSVRCEEDNRRLERSVIENADAVDFVCESVRDHTMHRYPQGWLTKTAVVPHCHDDTLAPPAAPRGADTPLTLVHAGEVYGSRSPRPLLAGLAVSRTGAAWTPEDVRLEMLGHVPRRTRLLVRRYSLEDVVALRGPVPYSEARSAVEHADAAVILDTPSGPGSVSFLPSKAIDHLPAMRPLLGIASPGSEVSRLLTALGCPVREHDDFGGIAEVVCGMLETRKASGSVACPYSPEQIEAYEMSSVGRRIQGRLLEAMERR